MFFALHDTLPLHRIRVAAVNWTLIALNTVIFLLFESGLVVNLEPELSAGFGLIPSVLFGSEALPPQIVHPPAPVTLATQLFLHGNWWHLLSNMLFLQVFGNNVEDAMGHWRYLAFYMIVGMISAFAYAYANPLFENPLIGASGAISGVLAAYMMLNPRALVFGLLFGIVPMRISALWAIGTWIVFQIGQVLTSEDLSIAFMAHVGGFMAGLALVGIFKASGVRLFSQER